jgi:hypothetical protein
MAASSPDSNRKMISLLGPGRDMKRLVEAVESERDCLISLMPVE